MATRKMGIVLPAGVSFRYNNGMVEVELDPSQRLSERDCANIEEYARFLRESHTKALIREMGCHLDIQSLIEEGEE